MFRRLPQARLWHRLKDEGRLLRESTGENTDGVLNFMPKMGIETLNDGYRRILASIYAPKQYYQRINTFLENYTPTAISRIQKEDIVAFLRSAWRVGILSKARFLLLETTDNDFF